MTLGQAQAEQALHHRGEVHPVVARQPARQLGVKQRRRSHADFGQAGEVLVGGVQDPLVGAEHLGDRLQPRRRIALAADRVDEHRACTGAADLNQIRPP